MSFQYTLQKVLELKQSQKNEFEAAYKDATDHFEKVATQLYHLLKKKEGLEEMARNQLQQGTSIKAIQFQETTLSQLEKEILILQQQTQQARLKMVNRQDQLMNATVEMKKYEKIKQREHEQYKEESKRIELLEMNELSIQAYANR
ncbi:flagellar export protein FliJ [Halalkalibacter sp. AB-rgal2]|uniref:flagellar export protein FliJ n=1 Tax=Halalkalibacter sp. AB-rgal2 TaxID=3242695 RepID=UPI00359CCE02